jgi:serine phosphatase RsbU (regulator of sigma subunit)/PAS domain-containing protein
VATGWARQQRTELTWTLIGVAVATALAIVDATVSHDALFIGVLVAGPLLTSFGASARTTALVAVYAVLLALAVGIPHDVFLEIDEHLTRVLSVVVGGAIAVWIARARYRERTARRRYSLIAGTTDIVQRTLDPEVMMIEVARLLAHELGDWCFVFLKAEPKGIRQVAAMHRDSERQRLAWELLRRYPLDPGRPEGPAAAMRDGKPRLYRTVDERLLASISADEDNLRLLEQLGMSSVLVVPLTAHGTTFGAMAVAAAESGQAYDEEDLDLAQELADRVAVAVDNARLYEHLSGTESDLRRSRDELQAILDGVADAVTAQGRGAHLVFANQAAVDSFGFDSIEELLATPAVEIANRFEFTDGDGNPIPLEELPGRKALGGDPAPDPILTQFHLKDGGPHRWVRVKALPVFDESGEPVLAINVIEDVTEEREATEAQTFLSEAGRILSSSLDYDTTITNVARLAVPRIGDWCAVDLLEEDGTTRPVVVAHVDPAKVEWAIEMREKYPPDPTADQGVHRVLRTGEPELYPIIPRELLVEAAVDEEHLRLIDEIGMTSAMTAPLIARGRTLGAITFVTSESGRTYDEGDLALAQELATRCAIAVDNARLFRERTHIARTLQESLLPPELPQPPGLDVAARFRAAGEGYEVGGDFYDLFNTGSDRWAAVIGDVCGKGPEAAAITALARYTLRATAMTEHVPSRILARLNEAMLRQRTDRRFSTVLYAALDQSGQDGTNLRFASGGHPLPLLLRAGGAATEVGTPGTLLGIVPDPDLVDDSVDLRPGDAVVLYTDGVTDAAAPELVHEPHELASVLESSRYESAEAIADGLLDLALGSGNGAAGPRDDIAILVIKVPEQAAAALSQ